MIIFDFKNLNEWEVAYRKGFDLSAKNCLDEKLDIGHVKIFFEMGNY